MPSTRTIIVNSSGGANGTLGGAPGIVSFQTQVERYGEIAFDNISVLNAAALTELHFFVLGIDDTDTSWWGIISGSLGTANPTTFTPHIAGNVVSRVSINTRTWEVGDYILFNNPNILTISTAQGPRVIRRYEICKILAKLSNGDWVISRGEFGTPIVDHDSATGFWRMLPTTFSANIRLGESGIPTGKLQKHYTFGHPSMTVAIVVAQGAGVGGFGPATIENLLPIGFNPAQLAIPACPGIRTCDGSEYILRATGELFVGQTADSRIPAISYFNGIRNILGSVRLAPQNSFPNNTSSNPAIIAHVVLINPTPPIKVYLIEDLHIRNGNVLSVMFRPDMPAHLGILLRSWLLDAPPLYDWPPQIFFECPDACDPDTGLLIAAPPVPDTSKPMSDFTERMQLDFILSQVGSVIPGSDLGIAVQG